MKNVSVRTLAKIAILGAIAFVLMYFDFPLPFAPSFYKLDFSEVAVLIGGFAMGWGPAVAIEGLKIVLSLLFKGTSTAYVGELANFVVGCAFAVPAALIYHRNKTRKTAITGIVVGALCMTFVGVIMNYFVLLPAYSYFYHMDMEVLIGMGSAIIPLIKDRLSFVLLATTPFNLFKGLVVGVVTSLLYKHISPLLHK
ncbi:MAG: ECF transporter S component [Solobacterium sp.]|nr:ECF transporter S component [Solobacterium sp.]